VSRRANPAAVGAFVLVGLAILVAGVLVLGGGRLFTKTARFVVFFEDSVNGLAVGSPVKVSGVPVGQVLEINAIVDATTWKVLTRSVIELDPERLERRGVQPGTQIPIDELIANGLRARLEMQSLLTGQLYVDLGFRPETEAKLIGGELPYPEIPSLPTTAQEIEAQVREALQKLSELPLDEIVHNLNASLSGVARLANDPNLPRAIENLDGALVEARKALASFDQLSQQARRDLAPVAAGATATLSDAKRALEEARGTLGAGSPLAYQISVTLQELDRTLQAIRLAAEEIERNPRAMLFGRSEKK